jgi:hypothetical protein
VAAADREVEELLLLAEDEQPGVLAVRRCDLRQSEEVEPAPRPGP